MAALRFPVDQGISPTLASALRERGHDAVHTRDRGIESASDPHLVALARAESRVIVTQDTDFGTILIFSRERFPSVILFRDRTGRPQTQLKLLLEALGIVQLDLLAGAIVVIEDDSIRVRRLSPGD